MFQTEEIYDYVTLKETQYSGSKKIDVIHSSVFTVTFHSDKKKTDKGFVLDWSCLKLGEWTPVGSGTCKEMRKPKPKYKGKDANKYVEFRDINGTCSEFIYFFIFYE